jgi:hypothetical protein
MPANAHDAAHAVIARHGGRRTSGSEQPPVTHFNPVHYMIGLVRYGFLGYSEANVALSPALLTLATLALFAVNLRPFSVGYRLRA